MILWFGLSLLAAIQQIVLNKINNFQVFRHVFFHMLSQKNLYLFYPAEYADVNLYGPVFSLVIAPFALLPVNAGVFFWVLANLVFLFWAISRLPVSRNIQTAIIFLCSNEMMNNCSWLQSNALVCGSLMLAFSLIVRKKEHWALFFIILATFVKLYGVLGLAFFPLSQQKGKFIGWALLWSSVCFLAPLLLTSFSFLLHSYQDWYQALTIKTAKNTNLESHYYYQDISVMGLIRRIFYAKLNDLFVIIPGIALFLSQFMYSAFYQDLRFQLYILCSSLLFIVLFSTGSESPTYIIALPAICLWYLIQPKTKGLTVFFIIVFLFTTFSYSDLLTPSFREYVAKPYSLKALPSLIVWVFIIIQIHRKQFMNAGPNTPDPISAFALKK